MRLIPFESLSCKTNLKPDEILDSLSEVIEPKQIFRFSERLNDALYEGVIDGNSFSIQRTASNGLSLKPQIIGIIESDSFGTVVHLKVRFTYFALGIIFCLIAASLISLLSFYPDYSTKWGPYLTLIPFVGGTVIIYSIVLFIFNNEIKRSTKFFSELLDSKLT